MSGVLKGLKILDFSTLLPGPYATMLLAGMGAEVLHVASKTKKDLTADMPPFIPETKLTAARAWLYRNKKSIALNLKDPEAIEIIKRLVSSYDIIVEQFRPGVMSRLGLGYEDLKQINPGIIYCSITGYGQKGPLSMRAGHDINYLARSGMMGYSGKKDGIGLMGIQLADVAGGTQNAVIGILAAVIYRKSTGKGQYIDISMADGAFAYNGMVATASLVNGRNRSREDGLLNGGSLYDYYETKDGKYLSVGSLEPKFFETFCKAIGAAEIIREGVIPKDPKIKQKVRDIIKKKTRDEWEEIFGNADACVEPVLDITEALEDEHFKERGMIIEMDVPGTGRKVRQLGIPLVFSENPVEYDHIGAVPGTDTAAVLMELGYSRDEIDELEKNHVLE